jgi:hypothetical protein
VRSANRRSAGLGLLLAACAVAARAQEPTPTPSPSLEGMPGADTIKSILEQELQPAPGGYSYNSQGRRDPFVSLLKRVAADEGKGTRPHGVEGFLIQEVALKGIVKTAGGGLPNSVAEKAGFIALILGTDGKSYPVREGQKLYDGVITSINATTMTFRQDITDPLSPVKTRQVTKSLYEEARQ